MLTVQFDDIQLYLFMFYYFGLWVSFVLVNALFHFTLAQLLAFTNISSILIVLHYVWAFVLLFVFIIHLVLLKRHPRWAAIPLVIAGVVEIAFYVDLWMFTGEFTRDYILTLMTIFRSIYLMIMIRWIFYEKKWRSLNSSQSSINSI